MSNPYASIPPTGRLLDEIIAHCAVGQTITPGNRQLAKWSDLASVGGIPGYLMQLVADGWITYDPRGGKITLLRTPYDDAQSSNEYADYDPYLAHPDEVTDYLMSLPRRRPRGGGK